MKNFNLHLHTNYSDGRSTMREYIPIMKKAGYSCLITSDHDYCMDPIKYQTQLDEAKILSEVYNFPIFNCLEISLFLEEAVLINPNMCMDWLKVREEIKPALKNRDSSLFESWIKQWENHNYGLVLVHPHGIYYKKENTVPELYKYFHAYEIANCGNNTWQGLESITKLKELMPNANQIAGMDAHGSGWINDSMLKNCNNLIDESVVLKTYDDVIQVVKEKQYNINPKILIKNGCFS